MIVLTRAKPTQGNFSVSAVNEAIQSTLVSVTSFVPDHFRNQQELWMKIKTGTPQMPESASVRRLAEIERDRKLFGEATSSVLLEGWLFDGVAVKCLIGEKFITLSLKEPVPNDREDLANQAIPKLKNILKDVCSGVEFDDVSA